MCMFVGVQGRLTRPQPIDYGVTQGLVAALCGRYAGLRGTVIGHSVLRREIPVLIWGGVHYAGADGRRPRRSGVDDHSVCSPLV